MTSGYPRVYRSFAEFERRELRKLDNLYHSVDDMVDELLYAELEDERPEDDGDEGILFDQLGD